jgi:solute carrier family 25 protein 16
MAAPALARTPPPPPSPPPSPALAALPLVVKEIIAGGAAGATAKSCVAPLERVKILFQTGRLAGASTGASLASIARAEGLPGLLRGNGASVARIVPYSALHFGAYERYRSACVRRLALNPASVPPAVDLVAGAAAGATAVVATYPLDLARTRLAYATEGGVGGSTPAPGGARPRRPHLPRATIRSTLAATLAADGPAGLYRGMGPTLAGILPYAGLKFYVYQAAKHSHAASAAAAAAAEGSGGAPPPPRRPPILLTLAYGAGAGLIAQTVTYPLDVVRRQMQVQGLPGGAAGPAATAAALPGGAGPASTSYSSTLDGLRRVRAAGGWRALFAGVSINYMKVVPSTAIGFTVYDGLKGAMGLPHNL